jgi:hypothetical protein
MKFSNFLIYFVSTLSIINAFKWPFILSSSFSFLEDKLEHGIPKQFSFDEDGLRFQAGERSDVFKSIAGVERKENHHFLNYDTVGKINFSEYKYDLFDIYAYDIKVYDLTGVTFFNFRS